MSFLCLNRKLVLVGFLIVLTSVFVKAEEQVLNQPAQLENPSFLPQVLELPVVRIQTKNAQPVIEKDVYLDAVINIEGIAQVPKPNVKTYVAQIKGRGNSTWTMPKKPYRLKFETADEVLGMPAHKDWALLANYADKTLLRNQVAFHAASELKLGWTPKSKAVEVFLNDQYMGVYQFTETITVSKHRLNIFEAGKKETGLAPSKVGYLLEIDQRLDEDFCFHTALHNLPFCLKAPKANEDQKVYITNYINQIETTLFSADFANQYSKVIDVESFIDFYLVNEVAKNVDAKSFSSIYLHKDANGKLKMGPVWDFDLGFGNANYMGVETPSDFWVKLGPWYEQLFKDPDFEKQVIKRWKKTKPQIWDKLSEYIDKSAKQISWAQENNFKRWTILDQYVWPNPVVTGSYPLEVDYLKVWLKMRMEWLDQQWSIK